MYPNKTYIALGTNIGNWRNNFNQALGLISKFGTITKLSSVYISNPYGYKRQNFFFNSALELQTLLSPYMLLDKLHLIERKLYKNKLFKNGPRKIDLDIIFFNKLIINSIYLKIPHTKAHQRDFVLLPIIEMNPLYVHPSERKTIISIYSKIKDKYVFKIMRHRKESLTIY